MVLRKLIPLFLIGCSTPIPAPKQVYIEPLKQECPKPPPPKITMFDYCKIKTNQQIEYLITTNSQPECKDEKIFLTKVLEEGIKINDYETDAYCQGISDAEGFEFDDETYKKIKLYCDPSNKTQNYKKESAHILDKLLDENSCLLRERIQAAFNIGYYCPSHSPEIDKWERNYKGGFMSGCILGRGDGFQEYCTVSVNMLYGRIK